MTDSKGIDANSLATLGRLYPSQSQRPSAVNDGAPGRPYGLIPCISPAAAWMSFDRGAPNSPTVPNPCQVAPTGFPNQKEFLIFRLPISVVGESDPCPTVDIKMIGTLTCHSGLTGTGSSGCYDIKIRVKNNGPVDITHLTIRPAKGDPLVITRLVTKGTTRAFIMTICTPLSGVGSWLDVSPVFKGEGICCSEQISSTFQNVHRIPA